MKRLCCFLIVCYALIFETYAQQYNFTNYSINEGLSQSVVNCVFQDSKGYVWLGTQNGLDRFDGNNFELYRFNPADSNSISNNWIYAISEDQEQNLWVGTKGGLHKYIRADNRFEKIEYHTDFETDLSEYSYDNFCLTSGEILINTPPVISICNPANNEFQHYKSNLPFDASVKDVRIPVLESSEGMVWVGASNGLASFKLESKQFNYYTFKNIQGKSFSEANVTALFQDNTGQVWVGTDAGLYKVNASDGIAEEVEFELEAGNTFSAGTCVRSIVQDKKGNLLLATEGNGLYFISQVSETKYKLQNFRIENSQIGHNIVQTLLVDKSDNLWIGTLSGVSKTNLKTKKFKLYRNTYQPGATNLLGNVIAGMYKNDDGTIWVGNWGQGLNLVNPETNTVEHFSSQHTGNHFLPNDFAHVVFKDKSDNIWLGTRDGVFVYDLPKNRFQSLKTFFKTLNFPSFENTRIYDIIQDEKGKVWVASSNGLYVLNIEDSDFEVFNAESEMPYKLSANLIYSLLEDSEGLIWMATINGLDVYDPTLDEIKHFRKESSALNSDFIISLCEDGDGNIWVGSNAYANIFDKKTASFAYFGEKQGLPSNYIYGIKRDLNNNIWLATGNGLCMFDTKTNELEIYTPEDGLQSLEFNLRAQFMAPDGQMLFGGMNGFNTFYPDSIAGNPYVPNLEFTAFQKTSDGIQEEINVEKGAEIVLSHKVQSFIVEFAALEFTNPLRNTYSYKMEGISDKWEDIGNRNFVPFFALAAGEYTFRVRGANNDGVWNDKGISLRIVVLPPWWKSDYAYGAYLLLLVLFVFAFIKLRERKLQQDNILLEKKVAQRTLQIEEQNRIITSKNKELNELNRTKDKFFSIIGHDLGNHFNIIVGFTEVLLSGFRKMNEQKQEHHLRNIYKSSIQAHDLLGNLLTWSRLQRNAIKYTPEQVSVNAKVLQLISFHEESAFRKNILIEVFSEEEICIYVDVNMFSTIIRNLLGNAIKFTLGNGEVSVTIKKIDKFCELLVKDTGVGIAQENLAKIFEVNSTVSTKGTEGEKGTGLGLVLCKEFVEKHGGTISVESEKGKGSCFVIRLPLCEHD